MKNRLLILILTSVAAGLIFYAGCGGGSEATITTETPPVVETAKYWVSASEGSDTNLGTIQSPFATIGKGVSEAVAAGGVDSVFVVAGTYHENVVVGDAAGYYGISLYGGYGAYDAATDSRPRDIVANVTQVDRFAVDGSAGAPVNGSEAVVDGFLVSYVSSLNASPTIKSNRISHDAPLCGGRTALFLGTTGSSVSTPVISENVIDNVSCTGSISEIVGVELSSAGASQLMPQMTSNQVTGGSGVTTATHAIGLLGRAADTSAIELSLVSNTIVSGTSVDYSAAVNLWADSATSAASVVALSNNIRAGTSGQGYGLDLGFDSISDLTMSFTTADIQRNKIFGGTNCIFSAGISVASATSASTITNNFVSAGKSTQLLAFEEGIRLDVADADIINNTIVAETGDTAYLIDMVSQTAATKVENNILFVSAANTGGVLSGILEAVDTAPASVKNNLFDDSLDIVYSSSFGGFGDLLNVADLVVSYPVYTANIEGDADLVDPANLDLHIGTGSAAIDAADSTLVIDYDGESRPLGAAIDIGADEAL